MDIKAIYREIEDMAGNGWFYIYPSEKEIEWIFSDCIKPPDYSHDGYYENFTLEWKLNNDESIVAYHNSFGKETYYYSKEADCDIRFKESVFDIYTPDFNVTVCGTHSLTKLVNFYLERN